MDMGMGTWVRVRVRVQVRRVIRTDLLFLAEQVSVTLRPRWLRV